MNAMDEQLLRVLRTDNPWLTGAPLGPWIGRHLPAEWVPRRLRLSPGERVTLVIDFVVEHRGRRLAFEVKAGDPRGKVSRGARSFIEAYEPETLVIIHLAKDGREADESREQIGETRVRTVALEDLDAWLGDLMENSSA